ncbi:MAG: DDE-type integrase/transposase/recombinase [Candidatus Thiodiazotropha endolucinida]|nr:DDE-type integrase/transposase/recombinase [Candidatus Thiodiazotropha taylori]MCW4259918.1 DDE-type integrase/transposase/recombinase [Candidatus Thiodiazotropha endolucinida]
MKQILKKKTAMNSKEQYLQKVYTDPGHPASFSGPAKLKQVLDREGRIKVSKKDISSFLEKQDSYTVNRSVRRIFRRGRIVTRGIRDQYDLDLVDMGRLSKFNDNVKFLLTAIDAFSRVAMVKPLKNKTAQTVLDALKTMLSGNYRPRAIRSDMGSEFKNSKLSEFLEANNIKHFFAHPPLKAQIVERFNQSLKQLIYRYLHNRNTYRYIDRLEEIVRSYNTRPHRALGLLSPSEVSKSNEIPLWNEMYINRPYRKRKHRALKGSSRNKLRPVAQFSFKERDLVRVSFNRRSFERSFHQRFSEEVFRIRRRFLRENIPVYLLADLQGEIVQGYFYGPELQKVSLLDDQLFKVQKILKRRGKGRNREVLVRFLGYPPKFDQWLPISAVESI